MAKVDIKMPEDFLQKISRLGSEFDAVAESVLEAGGEVVLARVKDNLSGVVGQGTKYDSRSTGELEGLSACLRQSWTETAITMSKSALWSPALMVTATLKLPTYWNTENTVSLQSPF